jgi:hypothetical protein
MTADQHSGTFSNEPLQSGLGSSLISRRNLLKGAAAGALAIPALRALSGPR